MQALCLNEYIGTIRSHFSNISPVTCQYIVSIRLVMKFHTNELIQYILTIRLVLMCKHFDVINIHPMKGIVSADVLEYMAYESYESYESYGSYAYVTM